ncbi:MAG: CinA family protein [Hyphomicrobiaceae bacterium]
MFPPELLTDARRLLTELRAASLMLATAESCTGGLVAALLTEIPGSSDVLERGFVTYSNRAKITMLGVDPALIDRFGAVSDPVARAMAEGALIHSEARMAVSLTGVAGPDGGRPDKPVGLVHMAVARSGAETRHAAHQFAAVGRTEVRLAAVQAALTLVREAIDA